MTGAALAVTAVNVMPPAGFRGMTCPTVAKPMGAMLDEAETWEALLSAANAGDGRAFGRFLRTITPVIRSIVRARGRALGPDQHEDIVQEVLLAVHLKRQTWQPGAPVRPWLYAVVRYKVIDAFRRRGSHLHLPIDDFAEILAAERTADPLVSRDTAHLLAQIDGRSADIVRAISLEGETTEQVGTRLSMTEGAVRVAFHRAMKRLAALGRRMDQ